MAGSLKEQLHEEITASLKGGDKVRLGALRMLSAAVTNKEKDLRHELDDDELRAVAGSEMKKRAESIDAFEAAGRAELAEKERAERVAIEPYAPAQLDDAEVDALIDDAFVKTGAAAPQDLGKVMGYVMGRAKGQVDGGAVQRKVRERLGPGSD